MSETPPDRLSNDPRSKFYDEATLERGIGIRFNGEERQNVEEYCVSEGWIRVAAGRALDRRGNPITLKLNGTVEPYFRDDAAHAQIVLLTLTSGGPEVWHPSSNRAETPAIRAAEGVSGLPAVELATPALTGWDTAEQGTTYTLTAEGYKIGENGVQLGLPSDSSTVNTQAVIAAALTIVNTAVTAPNKNTNTVGFTTITISAVNAPSRELTVAIFGLEEAERVTVTEPVIEGIPAPVARKYPAKVVREGRQFTGTVAWSPSAVAFNYATVYTATITLKAKVGYTFDGVAANFFTAAGAASVSNAANSGVVTAVYPATAEKGAKS